MVITNNECKIHGVPLRDIGVPLEQAHGEHALVDTLWSNFYVSTFLDSSMQDIHRERMKKFL
jgi:hypothetical protein